MTDYILKGINLAGFSFNELNIAEADKIMLIMVDIERLRHNITKLLEG